ncbi:unnamed protein product [Aureobasidium mustum]|uniref:Uncharacterized protein n=1 Tax=Aureobasidium mustum TaxID=2773714 RepID=A0A9N8JEH5_9PEZI|nr:unnamed protein product [Aureobasidium mustum]
MEDQAKYTKLEETSESADDIDATDKHTSLVMIVWIVSRGDKFHVPHVVDCDCGSSIKEAEAKGCRFDSLAVSWLPPLCRDDKLLDEFERAGPGPEGAWLYYADSEATKPMTLDEVASLAELPLTEATFLRLSNGISCIVRFTGEKSFACVIEG